MRTPNQATRSGGAAESTITSSVDSLPNRIIGKHFFFDAVYLTLPVPRAEDSENLAFNLMKNPRANNALR